MKIFVSVPSAHRGYAQKLTQALAAQRHEVVSERLPAPPTPTALHEAVRDAIAAADLFIFVLAPESLAAGSATRLELRRAQRCWPEPAGHVLTVPVAPTPWQDIPRYLRQCTRVRAPGPGTVIPDASVCVAAVAELEKKWRALPRSSDASASKHQAGLDSSPHSGPHNAPDSRPYSAADSTIGGGNGAAVMLARPAGEKPAQNKPTAEPARAQVLAAKTWSAPSVGSPAPRAQAVSPPAAVASATGASANGSQVFGAPPVLAPAVSAEVFSASAVNAPAPSLAAAAASPIVAHPAHAADWAGQRSWRRGKSRRSGRRRGHQQQGLWGLLREYGGLSLGVGCLALLLLAALAWQWKGGDAGVPRAPATPSAELAEMAIADPVARKAQRALRLCQEGRFASASQQLAVMAEERGAPPFVRQAREDCAMAWLRGAEVRHGESNFTQLVAPLRPLLAQALAVAPAGTRMADLRAHLGWADFLIWLDSRSPSFDPTASYQAALAQDPGNAYAQAMAAVWSLVQGQGAAAVVTSALASTAGDLGAAAEGLPASVVAHATSASQLARAQRALVQFQAASTNALARRLTGDREALAFVRRLQLGNLGPVPELSVENIRMLDDMRRGNEPQEPQLLKMAWAHLYASAYQEGPQRRMQAALSAEDNLKTFLWCFPKSEPGAQQDADRSVWRLVHGMLLTHAGRGREARADLAALHAEVRMNLGAADLSRAVDRLLAQRQ
jgi:hypothetical protein